MLDENTMKLLPNEMYEMLMALKQLNNTPDEISVPATLATMNFAAQALTDVNPWKWKRCPTSLYFGVISGTGTMKTHTLNSVTEGIDTFTDERMNDFKRRETQYKIDIKRWEREIKDIVNNPQGNCTVPDQPQEPVGNIFKVKIATKNGLINTLNEVPFVGLFSADAGELFNSYAFQDKSRGLEMVSMLSDLYSGSTVERTTGIKENNVHLKGKRMNMIVMLQEKLAGFIIDPEYNQQGFIPRMLITQAPNQERLESEFTEKEAETMEKWNTVTESFHERINDMLHQWPLVQKQQNVKQPNEKQLVLPVINFAENALPLAKEVYNRCVKRMNGGEYTLFVGFIERAYEQFCRIAATLAVFEGNKEISVKNAEAADGLLEWFVQQRRSLSIETQTVDDIYKMAEEVRDWIVKKGGRVTKGEITANGPRSFHKANTDMRNRVLVEICDREWGEVERVKTGKRDTTYFKIWKTE